MVLRYRLRLYFLMLVFGAGVSVLLMKLWSLQIDQFETYRDLLPDASYVTVRVPGTRGEIKDRNGVTLVSNEPNFQVIFDLRDIINAFKAEHGTVPKHQYGATVGGIIRPRNETDVVKIVNEFIIPGLEELGLAVRYNARSLRIHYRSNGGVVPWIYRSDLTFQEFATFAEHNLGLPGVSISVRPKRKYLYGAFAPHVLGYVKLADIQKVSEEERREFDFYVGDDYGVSGVEKSMDVRLRGRSGKRILLKDEKGSIVGEVGNEPPGKGADVYLTLDARVQMIAENALREAGIGRGAAVVIQPATGDVLAMVSVPSFDPNNFIPTIAAEEWKRYGLDQTNPLINRALMPFAPGSTFKIPVALAGLYAGTGNRRLNCDGGQQYGRKFMRCWIHKKGGSHGPIDISDAIKFSCNDYFYQYGNHAGIDSIKIVGNFLGLGKKTGLPLDGEFAGRLPDPGWLRLQRGTSWTNALTALTAIGQGDNEATPVQMASMVATVANGGIRYSPQLISKIIEGGGDRVLPARPKPLDLRREGIKESQIELVRRGMWKVVNESRGTARRARSEDDETAGKTGTAQFKRNGVDDNHAWFIAFAPYDEPEVAVCVLVRGGKSGGGVAAPVAAKIIKETLALDKGENVDLIALHEAPGNFEPVDAVSYEDPGEETLEDEDGDTGTQVAARQTPVPRAIPVAEPNLRPAADAAGSEAVPRAVPVRKAVRFKRAKRRGSPQRR